MSKFDIEALLIACFSAVMCAICGVFLMLSKRLLQIEAVSHSVLLGIVLASLFGFGNSSIAAILLIGLISFSITSSANQLPIFLNSKADSVLTSVYAALFSLAVVLMNVFLRNSHIDLHLALGGELATVSFNQVLYNGREMGSTAFWNCMFSIFMILAFLYFRGRRTLIHIFDPVYSGTLGTGGKSTLTLLSLIVCLVAVTGLNVVGSVMTLSLFALPTGAAFLWGRSIVSLMWLSVSFATLSTGLGFAFAVHFDVPYSGAIGSTLAACFVVSAFTKHLASGPANNQKSIQSG